MMNRDEEFNIRYHKTFKPFRTIVKHFLSFSYPIVIKMFPLPKVMSIDDTLDKVIEDKFSIARFGDGEFLYLMDRLELPFQKYDERLAKKLKMILTSRDENILVGLPIGYQTLENLKPDSKRFWKSQITWIYPRLRPYLDLQKTYWNASITRVYSGFKDTSYSEKYFTKLMRIWEGREILLIEGEKSRLGVGNDLFKSAKSVRRILAPMHHAFSKYDELYREILKNNKSDLVLIALGPTATALAYDIALEGYQAVDIGNVDIEYEWYLQGATSKIKIEGKYTSEAAGGRIVEDIKDESYEREIIAKIL